MSCRVEKNNSLKKLVEVTALLINTQILKFKSQLTFAFFAAVNHLSGPLRKQKFTLIFLKVMVCDL